MKKWILFVGQVLLTITTLDQQKAKVYQVKVCGLANYWLFYDIRESMTAVDVFFGTLIRSLKTVQRITFDIEFFF
ncbi:MAG: hypothetical protein WC341_04755 [Bacteroidales bacterium]|jgi:hypothetical protein